MEPPRHKPTATETVLEVIADRPGERLDVAIARLCEISRAQGRRLIDEGLVKDGKGRAKTKAGDRLEGGERLIIHIPAAVPAEPQPEALPLNIVYEDDHLLVIDKPAGMAVHPGPGHAGGTLVNALLAHCPDLPGIGGVQRPGIVHRLDKNTSGLIVVAKDERAHRELSQQLKNHEIKKTYLALVEGKVEPAEALIDAPIARDPNNRQRMMVRATGGREAQTSYKVRARYDAYTYLEASPITGRTHQIRVHFASLRHPVVGDAAYGKPSKLVGRQFLHAWRLGFRHPIDGRKMAFEAPLPEELGGVLRALKAGGENSDTMQQP